MLGKLAFWCLEFWRIATLEWSAACLIAAGYSMNHHTPAGTCVCQKAEEKPHEISSEFASQQYLIIVNVKKQQLAK